MTSNEWDKHWSNRIVSLNIFFNLYRKYVMSGSLSYFFEKYFPRKGIFADCGSGSSITSYALKKHKRKFVALDISPKAIEEAKKIDKMDFFVHTDILYLPFKSDSIDGIWNLGVMEHFMQEDINKILKEFFRVLKKGSYIILFWPPTYSLTGIAYRTTEKLIKIVSGKSFRFYPDEISRLSSKKEAISIMKRNRFRKCKVYFPWRNCFGDLVVIAKK